MDPLGDSKESSPISHDQNFDRRIFATTRWSLILRARGDDESGRAALEALCRAYWRPVHAYLLRTGHRPQDADDFTQEFFARLLRRESFGNLSPERGRFRNFLLVSLRHFLSDERDKQTAARRGGGVPLISIDAESDAADRIEIPDTFTPEHAFERHWAESVLRRAREQLRDECAVTRPGLYEALGPEGNDADETYGEIGRRLGFSEEAVKSAAFRLRRRYRELIRAEVAETVTSETELEEELRHLLRVLDR
ncbi:MAG TPA: sigma-70 family RNA polymerase sigma factor [Candidatus Acidoferrum sp.]|nr:sigma-70 family RNA polymerase sigma factor [Candidatus Acidoferrum sp.]